jgi:alanine dehydrogenase
MDDCWSSRRDAAEQKGLLRGSFPMRIGIPKEIKPGEYRVAGLPQDVARLKGLGASVVVEHGAGAGSGYDDEEYARAGAEMAACLAEVYERTELIWKVKEILPAEFALLSKRHTIFTYLHAAPRPEMTRVIRESGCVAIAYEEMTDDKGRRPLLVPMS